MDLSFKFNGHCPICNKNKVFSSQDDFWWCRDKLRADDCEFNSCVVRERALAKVIFQEYSASKIKEMTIHEPAPSNRGISLWMKKFVPNYISTGFFPEHQFGVSINGVQNENLESQTFHDLYFDMVIHLDVMEHIFNPFDALNEIYRTLKGGGKCIFSAPTEHNRFESIQVAFKEDGKLRFLGEPEYHGNPQKPEEGSLVTWRYGYDLPLLITRNSNFKSVEVRRWQNIPEGIMGYMNEIYILTK